MDTASVLDEARSSSLLSLAQELVRIESPSGGEERAIRFLESRMLSLGFDEVRIDGFGNLLGRIGQGGRSILFDSHVDTVGVTDASDWKHPPYSGTIAEGWLWGRGSVDMKSALAASIHGAILARALGLAEGKTVYVSCSCLEEDCDGENLRHLFREFSLRPDCCVICEPSNNLIARGHKGKAQVLVRARGLSAHGSAPEKGKNAIYEMADIIKRVDEANLALARKPAPRGTLVMSRISSVAASLNAVPSECGAYLDRRIARGETEESVRREMDALVAGKDASWEVGVLERRTWTGLPVRYEPFHPAWEIAADHPLAQALDLAYRDCFGADPAAYEYWNFSTNAVTTVREGIPTIGFGPGNHKLAHMRDEGCPTAEILEACRFYARVIGRL